MHRVKNDHMLMMVWLAMAVVLLWFLFVGPQAL